MMTEIKLNNTYSEFAKQFRGFELTSELKQSLIMSTRQIVKNAALYARELTGFSEVKFSLQCNSEENYKSYFHKVDDTYKIVHNMASNLDDAFEMFCLGYSAEAVEKHVFSVTLTSLLHEFGHYVRLKEKSTAQKNIGYGYNVVEYVDTLNGLDFFKLANDSTFMKKVLESQVDIVSEELFADDFALKSIQSIGSDSLFETSNALVKASKTTSYYLFYAEKFVDDIVRLLLAKFNKKSNDISEAFVSKMISITIPLVQEKTFA